MSLRPPVLHCDHDSLRSEPRSAWWWGWGLNLTQCCSASVNPGWTNSVALFIMFSTNSSRKKKTWSWFQKQFGSQTPGAGVLVCKEDGDICTDLQVSHANIQSCKRPEPGQSRSIHRTWQSETSTYIQLSLSDSVLSTAHRKLRVFCNTSSFVDSSRNQAVNRLNNCVL